MNTQEAELEDACTSCGNPGAEHPHDPAWCSAAECEVRLCPSCHESALERQYADPESIER